MSLTDTDALERLVVKLLDKLHHWGDGDAADNATIRGLEAEYAAIREALAARPAAPPVGEAERLLRDGDASRLRNIADAMAGRVDWEFWQDAMVDMRAIAHAIDQVAALASPAPQPAAPVNVEPLRKWLHDNKPQPDEYRSFGGDVPDRLGGYRAYVEALQSWNEARGVFEANFGANLLQKVAAPAPVEPPPADDWDGPVHLPPATLGTYRTVRVTSFRCPKCGPDAAARSGICAKCGATVETVQHEPPPALYCTDCKQEIRHCVCVAAPTSPRLRGGGIISHAEIAEQEARKPTCRECGSDQMIYVDQYANGEQWRCRQCNVTAIHDARKAQE